MVESLLVNIGVIIVLSAFLAYIAKVFKQPLLVAYVIAGILLGPVGLKLITDTAQISAIAELGIAFLLFAVGLELDINKLKSVGSATFIGGIIQVAATFALGYILALFLGFSNIIGIYLGMLFAFSSTMIVAKILADKNELRTLHGRIMIGVLILQDIIVIIALPFLENIGGAFSFNVITDIFLKGIGLFIIAVALNRFVLKHVVDYAARAHEVLLMTSLAVAFIFIGLSSFFGFSIAIGAFIAGIALANFPYNVEIEAEIHSLRDFLSAIFFATLGLQLNFFIVYEMFPLFLLLVLFIIIAKPLILGLTYLVMGYGGRNASEIGLGLGQASEFMLIIAAQGLLLGHISSDIYSLIVSVVVISLIITPYLISSKGVIYKLFSHIHPALLDKIILPRKIYAIEKHPEKQLENHIVVIGCHIMGKDIADYLMEKKEDIVVIDSNPEVIRSLRAKDIFCVYGNANNEEVLEKAGLSTAKLCVIAIPDEEIAAFVIRKSKKSNPQIKIFAKAMTHAASEKLYKSGVDFVVVPDEVGGKVMSKEIEKFLKNKKIKSLHGYYDTNNKN